MPVAGHAERRRVRLPSGPYLVAGLGRAGESAARALARVAPPGDVRIWDGFARPQEAERAAQLALDGLTTTHGGDVRELLDATPPPRTLVKSPGLRFDVEIIQEAQRRGLRVIDEAELGWLLDPRPVIGITGTNGKSTTTSLVESVLRAAGQTPIAAGNTTFGIPYSGTTTQPGDTIVAELSSFQLEGCAELLPETAILTNLTNDHHYRHGSATAYAECKRRLFIRGDHAVPHAAVGIDQPFGQQLAADLRERGSTVVTFGTHPQADRRVIGPATGFGGGTVRVREGRDVRELAVQLTGAHNALNVAATLALADVLGIDADLTAIAIGSTAPLPGRFEHLRSANGFDVVIDFAHNPDGVAKLLETARSVLQARGEGRLIAVLSTLSMVGRPHAHDVGRIGAELSDHLVLTTQRWTLDDPAEELPDGFWDGARSVAGAQLDVEYDRGDAISGALAASRPGDLVVVLDRGEREGVIFDRRDQPQRFDDRALVRSLLAARTA